MRRWWVPGLARHLVSHPRDALVVASAAWKLRAPQWWRQRPWLPLPSRAYWDFRMSTLNGIDGHLDPAGVVSAARWSVQQHVGR
jgi:hypothetical protein